MTNSGVQLDLGLCRVRQQRVVEQLRLQKIDHLFLCLPANVQYLTGYRPHPLLTALLLVSAEGKVVLVAPNEIPEFVAADEVLTYQAQWQCTLRQDQSQAAWLTLKQSSAWPQSPGQLAAEGSANGLLLACECWLNENQVIDFEPTLWNLRRSKDPDELSMIRRAISGSEKMYAKAREIIEPGITELEVYHQLQKAVSEHFQELPTATGNDFQCNSPGGAPRPRSAEAGELFILDLGPAYRGYYADNCRTFAVDRNPTDEQLYAWNAIVSALKFVEQQVKPGVSASSLFREVQSQLNEVIPGGFPHHLGHGIGLYPHETPHLNDCWDDLFQVGDVFTAEPGLYSPVLKAGIRLEENYLVTPTGVEKLTSFPLEL